VAISAIAGHGIAADKTWTGAQSAFWSDPRNWQEGSAPQGGDVLRFNPGTPTNLNNDLGGVTYGDVIFNNAAVLNGNPLTVGISIIGFSMYAATTTVNVPLTLTGSGTIGLGSGSYVLSKNVNVGGQFEPAHAKRNGDGRFRLDLAAVIVDHLLAAGVPRGSVHVIGACTRERPELPSHRRAPDGVRFACIAAIR